MGALSRRKRRDGYFDVVITVNIIGERTLESLDDKRGCRGNDIDLGLTILDRELDGYPETLPGTGGLRDIFTDLLR